MPHRRLKEIPTSAIKPLIKQQIMSRCPFANFGIICPKSQCLVQRWITKPHWRQKSQRKGGQNSEAQSTRMLKPRLNGTALLLGGFEQRRRAGAELLEQRR